MWSQKDRKVMVGNKIRNNRYGREKDKKVKSNRSQESKKIGNSRCDREKGKK
jgi:hypothetical protein